MKAGIADRRRGEASGDHIGSTFRPRAVAFARRRAWRARFTLTLGLAALLAVRVGAVYAQDAAMLDERVTQQSIRETICRPGYASAVSPPFDELMAHKDRMLAERGIDADDGAEFALDRRVPVVLGGSPDAPSNLGLLPWAGRQGERRKARAAVMLKRCVCEGKLSLAEAQAAIVGDWSVVYSGFSQESCDISRLDVATSADSGRTAGRGTQP
ncbi:hypothetical protein SCB29_02100 [Paraburkholderia sp. SIMBA_055]|jgi:hypothetical protein|uniref:Uncharacterized protein n=1 Tax=Paraburkholderia graminis (strain ATCC 700544 / DSM 17151 / LMG 18924 / NCIMB 13744 / C4D1M) TaxID=396598 RepID=B1G812_PARG4|nr:hypothetical protein [Paraburkholderia graminis]EDT07724.1 conserved hypothetical protein [Paraburkholderia graminis C4D1M]MDR6470364.1 hypothetical protein [Paraburkholderia graminis]CAB3653100.1 hypothetical protein R8871_01108 [Paraburkholderia graminis C4D1M]